MTKRRSTGGGGSRNPRSLANLRRGVTKAPVGNTRSLRHGAYARVAEQTLDEKTKAIFDALAADAPLRDADGELPSHDAVMVRLLADCMCRLDSIGAWLAGRWATDEARPVLDVEMKLRNQALDLAESMGMTPRSRARLGLDVRRAETFDLARHWQEQGDA
jgi:hypothetical protein